MYRLSSVIWLLGTVLAVNLNAQNPHGVDFKTDCSNCHNADGWEIPADSWKFYDTANPALSEVYTGKKLDKRSEFIHDNTGFVLSGQHHSVDCRACHPTLVFSKARPECVSCHTDMHNQTVGMDCARCHNAENWLVNDITGLHYQNGFPLLGAHAIADCFDCHQSVSLLTFERIGNDCINCHSDEYASTTDPNHTSVGFSTNCIECHSMNAFDWQAENIIHDFFPLTAGHQINECSRCHTTGDYGNISPECYSCHQPDYAASANPDHEQLNFPTDCKSCHTTDPGWSPADFSIHDTYYPLIGAHRDIANNCAACHDDGFANTPNTCVGCHLADYNNTIDPNHQAAGFPTDCAACHNENSWEPATFDHDGQFFPIYSGKHSEAWDNCSDCHTVQGNYSVFSCIDCHEHSNRTEVDDDHSEVQDYIYASPDCLTCHPTGDE